MRKILIVTLMLLMPLIGQADIRTSTAEAMVICDFHAAERSFSVAAEYNAYSKSFNLYILNKAQDGSAYSLAGIHYGVSGGSQDERVVFKGAAAKLDVLMKGPNPQFAKFLWIEDLQTFTAESVQCLANVRVDYLEQIEFQPRMTVGN